MSFIFRRSLLSALGLWVGLAAIQLHGEDRPGAATNATAAPRFKIPRADVKGFLPPRADPAHVAIGERLFLETRFAQYFFVRSGGDANGSPKSGDPVVNSSATMGREPLPGPFAG